MISEGYDSADITTGYAHEIKRDYEVVCVGVYGRLDRCTQEMLDGIHAVGSRVFSIWEKGEPVSAEYFTKERGVSDGEAAASFFKSVGMPTGKPIFACVDYDCSQREIEGPITAYISAFRVAVMSHGYLSAAYGSGLMLAWFLGKGLIHFGYLAQSQGWKGRAFFRGQAAIVQGESFTMAMSDGTSFDCDRDTVFDELVLW